MGTITVTNLGKAYRQYPTRWSRLAEWVLPGAKPHHVLKWVMQDVSFTVNPGEAVGIIGINGADKSTLLKMITGTTQPTTGSVHITVQAVREHYVHSQTLVDTTDRLNLEFAGWRLNVRSSNTEPLRRLSVETRSNMPVVKQVLQKLKSSWKATWCRVKRRTILL